MSSTQSRLRAAGVEVGVLVVIAAVYFACAQLGLAVAIPGTNASPVWPPSGFAFAAVWILGRRACCGVLLGATVVNYLALDSLGGANALPSALLIGAGNTLQALVGATILGRFATRGRVFTRVRHVIAFVSAAVVACGASAALGAAVTCASGVVLWSLFETIAITWWLGDVVGVLTVGPILMLWSQRTRATRRPGGRLESLLVLAGQTALTTIAFGVLDGRVHEERHVFPYLTMPFFLWAALRLGPRVVALGTLITSALAAVGVARSAGPTAAMTLTYTLLELQAFIAAIATSALFLTSAAQELRESRDLLRREAQQRLRGVVDTLPEMIWMTGLDKGVTDISKRWLEFTGMRREQVLGVGWADAIHPEDLPNTVREYEDAFERRGPLSMETRARRADGVYRWILVTGDAVYDENGEFSGFIGNNIDITERRAAEEELRELSLATENAMSGVARVDMEGRFSMMREGYARMLGYEPRELLDRSWMETVLPQDHARVTEAVEAAARNGRAEVQIRGARKDGSVFHQQVLLVVATDADGSAEGYYSFMRDVTERVEAETAREQLEEELRQAQKLEAVGTLASGVAHDFNNVLTAINGYVDAASTSLPEQHPAHVHLAGVTQSVRQAAGVSQSLLTFAQRTPATKKAVQLGSIVEQSMTMLERLLPASIEVERHLPPDSPWVEADAVQVQQVLLNLAINARDALPNGGRLVVSVRTATDAEDGAAGVITVRDNGPGIPEDVQARMFEPFFTTKTRERGTGLGLSIVHGIVNDHGGELIVDSSPGRGTSIEVRLPCCDAPTAVREAAGLAAGPRANGQVLLTEDNPDVRSLMVRFLERAGYAVVTASDGEEALRRFREIGDSLSIAIMDLELPRRSGLSCLREMRATHPDLPTIIISGNAGQHLSPAELERERILHKPFGMAELVERVDEVLREPRVEASRVGSS